MRRLVGAGEGSIGLRSLLIPRDAATSYFGQHADRNMRNRKVDTRQATGGRRYILCEGVTRRGPRTFPSTLWRISLLWSGASQRLAQALSQRGDLVHFTKLTVHLHKNFHRWEEEWV